MKNLQLQDIDTLARGVAILGSGGGGDPEFERVVVRDLIDGGAVVTLINMEELPEKSAIFPVALVGAPLVTLEKIPTKNQIDLLFSTIRAEAGEQSLVLMPVEIGGGNGIVPFIVAARTGLPVLDADLMGRAFPEIPMVTPTLYGIEGTPFTLIGTDSVVKISHAPKNRLEALCRALCVELGSTALATAYPMDTYMVRRVAISGSISRAAALGEIVESARSSYADPIGALCAYSDAIEAGRGIITEVIHTIDKGFLVGSVTISGETTLKIFFKNEYLVVKKEGAFFATTPDIIALFDIETGIALTTDMLLRGIRCAVLIFQAPAEWRTAAGLALVGPQAFAFSTSYVSPYQDTV
jgi:uncharacterized protein